jgi:hypothetical protein
MDVDRLPAASAINSFMSLSTKVSRKGELAVSIGLYMEQGPDIVLVLSGVTRLHIDGDLDSWVDELVVSRLPQFGPWPEEARPILMHHVNQSEVVWLRFIGPREIEVVARELRVEVADREAAGV